MAATARGGGGGGAAGRVAADGRPRRGSHRRSRRPPEESTTPAAQLAVTVDEVGDLIQKLEDGADLSELDGEAARLADRLRKDQDAARPVEFENRPAEPRHLPHQSDDEQSGASESGDELEALPVAVTRTYATGGPGRRRYSTMFDWSATRALPCCIFDRGDDTCSHCKDGRFTQCKFYLNNIQASAHDEWTGRIERGEVGVLKNARRGSEALLTN